jgi:hypothetical protein
VSAQTAGQAAFEVAQARYSPQNRLKWEKVKPSHREQYEAEAKAAIDWQRAEDANPTAEDYDHAAEILKLRNAITELLDSTGLSDNERARWLEMAGLDTETAQ